MFSKLYFDVDSNVFLQRQIVFEWISAVCSLYIPSTYNGNFLTRRLGITSHRLCVIHDAYTLPGVAQAYTLSVISTSYLTHLTHIWSICSVLSHGHIPARSSVFSTYSVKLVITIIYIFPYKQGTRQKWKAMKFYYMKF